MANAARIGLTLDDSAFRQGLSSANSAFESSATSMLGMAGKIGGALTAVAGGSLSYLVSQSLQAGDALAKTADKLGLTTEALAGLRYAGEQSGVATATMDVAMQRFTRRLSDAAKGSGTAKSALKELGLDASALAKIPVDQAMFQVAGAMNKVKSQSDKVRLSFKLFDSGGVALVNTLAMGADGMKAAAAEADQLGIALSRQDTAKMEQTNDAVLKVQRSIQGIVNKITVELAPWITAVSQQFSDFALGANISSSSIATGIGDILKALGFVADSIAMTAMGWKKLELGFNVAKANILTGFGELDKKIQNTAGYVSKSGSFFGDVFNNMLGALPFVGNALEENLGVKNTNLANNATDAWTKVAQTFSEMDMKIQAGLPSEKINAFYKNLMDKANAAAAAVAKIHKPVKNSLADGLDGKTGAGKDNSQQLEVLKIERVRATGLHKIALKRETMNQMKALGQLSDSDALQRMKIFNSQTMQVELKAAKERAALIHDKPVQHQKAMDKISAVQRKFDLVTKKQQTKMALEQKKFADKMFSPITSAFQKSVNGMIQGTLTFHKAMKQMGQSIVLEFANMGVQIVTTWIKDEAIKTAATLTHTTVRTDIEATGASQSLLISAATSAKKIMMSAWEVMSNVYASISSIPIVGPFLAPVMAGAAFATVASYAGRVASASGGFDIPAGMNPMTQLHQQEMVLPAHIANPLRDMIAGGGNGGGNTTVVVQAMDARSFEGFLTQNANSLHPALKKLQRNFSQ